MELTYMVRGADGTEYGPVTLEQLSLWIREGRLAAAQEVRRSDMGHWAAAASFAELQPALGSPVPIPAVNAAGVAPARNAALAVSRLKSGASWFYWIAGLSLINSVVSFTGSGWRFILGLGITQILDGGGGGLGSGGKTVALVLDLMVAGVFVLFGVFAHKAQMWAFVVGMALFALDGLIFLVAQNWIGVGFHAFVLYCLFRGFSACRELRAA
jgi:hypothetical protein